MTAGVARCTARTTDAEAGSLPREPAPADTALADRTRVYR